MEQSDASYMPSLVAVLAGNTIGGLKELKQTSIPSGQREFVLISGLTQVCSHIGSMCIIIVWCVWGGGGGWARMCVVLVYVHVYDTIVVCEYVYYYIVLWCV